MTFVQVMDACLRCQSETKVDCRGGKDCVVVWGECNHSFHQVTLISLIEPRESYKNTSSGIVLLGPPPFLLCIAFQRFCQIDPLLRSNMLLGFCKHSLCLNSPLKKLYSQCCMSLWIKQNNRCPLCQQEWTVQKLGK